VSTGTVTDHDGNRQGDDRQREYHRIGSVSIGSKIAGICDKDLIDNVVQSSYQKRNNAGDGVHPHQFPNRFFFEKFIGMFQCSYLLAHKKRVRTRKPDLRFRCSLNGREYTTLSFQKTKGFLIVFSGRIICIGRICRIKIYIACDILAIAQIKKWC